MLYEVITLRHTHAELLQASAPVMACARDFLAETGTVMALADTQCTILSMEGDTRTLSTAENIHLLPGVAWSERVAGTNAIGTALAVGEPVQIVITSYSIHYTKLYDPARGRGSRPDAARRRPPGHPTVLSQQAMGRCGAVEDGSAQAG